ncbi:hypothetical protein DPMN_129578 [Dreissena polymorpha]|uniref:G-protein coupled receptors family 1 profile domain-containing protein n=1 Tax=Dreissena polymorpha TaxID=45954 RepID=A0A9D4H557_DREPO|nr:hypothetical protein DPMN_129578 [Dreissena polymorpha]
MTSSISVSVLTLTAISVERCVALPETIVSRTVKTCEEEMLFTACYPVDLGYKGLMIWQFVIIAALYCVPICLMGFTYSNIAFNLCTGRIPKESHTRAAMLNGRNWNDNDEHIESRKKAAKMLFAIVALFAMCFFPNHLLNVLRYAGFTEHVEGIENFALVAYLAIFLNSCMNPVIYNFMSDKFRKNSAIKYKTVSVAKRRITGTDRRSTTVTA